MALPSTTATRLGAIDLLRGGVIVLMALDHVRYYLSDARFDPTDPTRTTAALFATRWITHLCAPVFMWLAGVGARLSLGRGRNPRSLSRFLFTRGLWLVLLELTVARAAWQFNLDYAYSAALVLWALGWSMVALAVLIRLPDAWIGVIGMGTVLLHNAFDRVSAAELGRFAWVWKVLHEPGSIALGASAELLVLYPLVPWIGVMALGYVFGPAFTCPPAERHRVCLRLGAALCAGFVLLRAANAYGDPSPWSHQITSGRTVLSFLNTTKYPASLLYLMMTLGPTLLLVTPLDGARGRIAGVVRTIGQVPLFFWLLHVPLIHLVAVVFSLARYGTVVPWLVRNPPAPTPEGYGYSLPAVYAVTLAVVVTLYPLCRRFAELKQRRKAAWLSYL